MAQSTTPQVVQSCHELLKWLIPVLDQFPRNRRFTLGDRIEGGLLYVLERLVEAAYAKRKQEPLQRANLRLQAVRHLWRLAFELQVISVKRYEQGAAQMVEIGQQIGAWNRSREEKE